MSLSLDVVWVVPCSVAPAVTTTSPTGRTDASVSVEVCVRAPLIRRNNTFPVFATYLIPAASPPPLRGGAKSASNPFAGARKPGTWFSSLSGPAWAHADHADASSFWVCLAAPNAPMLPAAPPCALPPPSYLFSGAHRSPVSILFLSGLLAGCSPGVHPCGN